MTALPGMADPAAASLRLVEVAPNPDGSIERLFLLEGNPVSGPVGPIENAGILPDVAGTGRLRVFHFNDLHNHLTELSGPHKGTHRFSQMVQRVRATRLEMSPDEALLFLSIGDDHTGSVLDELLGWRADQFVLDASYRAYSYAGVDATVLGNHEFDRGAALLAQGIRQDARFPVLSANVHSSVHLVAGQDYHPGAIAVSGGLRIGMIGLTTHVETRIGQPDDPNFEVASPVATLKNTLPALADLVDVVLILSHCGFGEGAHQSGKATATRDVGEADFSLARAAAGLNKPVFLLGAHTHTKLNSHGLEAINVFDKVPVFQGECNGRYLGEIDLVISGGGYSANNICLHPIKPFDARVGAGHRDVDRFEQPGDFDAAFEATVIAPMIARVAGILNNEIARVETAALSFNSAVLDRYTGECALLNFMADAVMARLKRAGIAVDFALINGATVLAGVEPGSLSMGAWFDVMPYADEIFVAQVPGVELAMMLQNNAKRLLRAQELAATDHTGFVGRGFMHHSRALRYRIDPGASAQGARAVDIVVDGVAPAPGRHFNVAMPTYLALGAFGERWNGRPICGGVPGDIAGYDMRELKSHSTGLVYRDEVAAFITAMGCIDDAAGPFKDGRLQIISPNKGSVA